MFDGIKIMIKDGVTDRKLLNNSYLDFRCTQKDTGEVPTASERANNKGYNYKETDYKKLNIRVYYTGTVIIAGSLHYFYNDGLHNHNQYTLEDVSLTLIKLYNELGIEPKTARIQSLEFGVNLLTNPTLFIENLVTHKINSFNKFDIPNSNGKRTPTKGKQFGLKIYDKGLHFREFTDKQILRFEYKCQKMEKISKHHPIYLSDLIKPDIINRCGELLKQAFRDLTIKEPVNIKGLNTKEKELYLKGSNPNYWSTLTKQTRYRKRDAFNQLLDLYSTDRIKEKTHQIFIETLQNIINPADQTGYLLTDFKKPIRLPFDSLDNMSISNHSGFNTMNCITCGRDISNQKVGSKYCSEKTFGKDAKKCRNHNNNKRNNLIRKIHYVESKGILFPINQFLKIPEEIQVKINR
jgi:hypothetical protein